MSAGAIKW